MKTLNQTTQERKEYITSLGTECPDAKFRYLTSVLEDEETDMRRSVLLNRLGGTENLIGAHENKLYETLKTYQRWCFSM